jgi:hypothetical protein
MPSRSRWLKRFAIIAPCAVISFIPAFYAYENWKGQKDIDHFQAEMKAAGFSADLKSYFEPQVPESLDASQHPLIKNWELIQPDKKIYAAQNDVESSPAFAGKTDSEKADAVFERVSPEHVYLLQLQEALERPSVSCGVEWESIPYGSNSVPKWIGTSLFRNDIEALADGFKELAVARKNSSYLKESINISIQAIRHRQNIPSHLLGDGRALSNEYSIFHQSFSEIDDLNLFTEEDYQFLELKLSVLEPKEIILKSLEAELVRNLAYDTVGAFKMETNLKQGWSWDRHEVYLRLKGLIHSLEPTGMTASRHVSNWRYALHKMQKNGGDFTEEDARSFEEKADKEHQEMSDGRPLIVCFCSGPHRDNGYQLELFQDWQFNSDLSQAIRGGLSNEYSLWMVRCRIALQRFYLEYGYYPETLQALMPEYLPGLGPLDAQEYKKLDDDSCDLFYMKLRRQVEVTTQR